MILPPDVVLVLACGGRDYENGQRVRAALDKILEKQPTMWLMHGGARGADYLAGAWAFDRRIPCLVVPAHWERDQKAAGPIRNAAMLALQPSYVVAFPGGRGTAHMAEIAEKAKVPVWRVGW
jgi:hypothetical protein